MNKKQYEKKLEITKELFQLKSALLHLRNNYLSYIDGFSVYDSIIINGFLKKHDDMIRQEIEEKIMRLEEDLKTIDKF